MLIGTCSLYNKGLALSTWIMEAAKEVKQALRLKVQGRGSPDLNNELLYLPSIQTLLDSVRCRKPPWSPR